MKMNNTKLNLLLAWDWVKENSWLFRVILVVATSNFLYYIDEELPYKAAAVAMVATLLWFVFFCVREYLIYRKKIKLNKELLKDWNQKRRLIINKNRQLRYLNGHPITVMDKELGALKIIQSGKTDVILTTMN
jgi:hypothetical protein